MMPTHTRLSCKRLRRTPAISYIGFNNGCVDRPGVSAPQDKEKAMIVSWVLSKIRNYIQYRETVAELSRLTDRELDDLGISRYDIESVARQGSH
jgi:uncharacterized protein YjiS (DUF1127 family)